jgi:hypothetical protein
MNPRNLHLLTIVSLAHAMLACEPSDGPARLEPLSGTIDEAVPGAATRPERVVDTSYDDVGARKHAIGERVRFNAKILPGTVIQTDENGRIAYFALAADAQSTYVDKLRLVADELREFQKAHLPRAAKLATTKPKQFKLLVDQYLALMGKLEAVRPRPEDLVGIELAEAHGLARIHDWQHVIGESPAPGWMSPDRNFGAPATWASPTYETIATATDKVQALLQRQPPDFEAALPEVEPIFVNPFDDSEVRRYNRLVHLYNKEVTRRRVYLAQRMSEDVITALAFIDDLVNAAPHAIEASITADHGLASQTFGKVYDGAPRAYVRESNGSDTFVKRYHARTHLLITSYPTGATVSIAGETVGKTPYLMRDLAVGASIDLALARRGHATFTKPVIVEASALGVARFEGVLQPPVRRSR